MEIFSNNLNYLLATGITWLLTILGWTVELTTVLNNIEHIVAIFAFIAAIIVSVLTAIKLKRDYKVSSLKTEALKRELKIKDQELAREIELTRRLISKNIEEHREEKEEQKNEEY